MSDGGDLEARVRRLEGDNTMLGFLWGLFFAAFLVFCASSTVREKLKPAWRDAVCWVAVCK